MDFEEVSGEFAAHLGAFGASVHEVVVYPHRVFCGERHGPLGERLLYVGLGVAVVGLPQVGEVCEDFTTSVG